MSGSRADNVWAAGLAPDQTLFGYLSIISRTGEDLIHEVAAHLSEPVREEIMELEEMLAQKKLEQGRAEGRAAVLLKLFQLKFGTVPEDVERRIREATDEENDRWAERVLTAVSLDDVLR